MKNTAKYFVLTVDRRIIAKQTRSQAAHFIKTARADGKTLHVTHYSDSRRGYGIDVPAGFLEIRPR